MLDNERKITERECNLRHEPLEKCVSRMEKRMDRIYQLLIVSLIGLCTNLLITLISKIPSAVIAETIK